jgi:hypothetical protein
MCLQECALRLTAIIILLVLSADRANATTCPVRRVDLPGSISGQRAQLFRDWLCEVAGSVTSVYGRFPARDVFVRVTPTGYRSREQDRPVTFGRIRRGDIVRIDLYADVERPLNDFYGDWTATHEFSHLLLPRLDAGHRWLSEGFASYYQNVLMARAGHYMPDYALRMLTEGFGRGRASRPDLSPNEAAHAGMGAARYKIYWSGAAFFLLADVELRKRSGGRESLDTVLDGLGQCCLPTSRRWSGETLLSRLDAFLDEPLFEPLYERLADTPGFPDTSLALTEHEIINAIFTVRTSTH